MGHGNPRLALISVRRLRSAVATAAFVAETKYASAGETTTIPWPAPGDLEKVSKDNPSQAVDDLRSLGLDVRLVGHGGEFPARGRPNLAEIM